jgi:hypothetical protein
LVKTCKAKRFATAIAIINEEAELVDSVYFGCSDEAAEGSESDRIWIKEHIVPFLPEPNRESPRQVRDGIWDFYMKWNEEPGFSLWADCGFPVEDGFLLMCVRDGGSDRIWDGPYPLQEIATIRTALGLDPTLPYELSQAEQHNPVIETQYVGAKLVKWLDQLRVKAHE